MYIHAVFVLFFYLSLSTADNKCDRLTFKIQNVESNLVLTGPEQGVKGNLGELWLLTVDNLGAVEIRNYYSGNCLDNQRSRCVENGTVLTYACHGGRNQRWFLNSDGTIAALCNRSLGLAFDSHGRVILTRIYDLNIVSKFIITEEKPNENKHENSDDDDSSDSDSDSDSDDSDDSDDD